MSEIIQLVSSGGVGDQILAAQCAYFVYKSGKYPLIRCCARDEVFNMLQIIFKDIHKLEQLPEDYGDKIVNNPHFFAEIAQNQETYLCWPDLLYRHPKSFDWQKFNTHPQIIRSTRLLLDRKKKSENIIYAALNTTTPFYKYDKTRELLIELANNNPDYQIYFNNITKWANQAINNGDLNNLPDNVILFDNQSFEESFELLRKSCYCVCLDNGIAHISFHLGIPRCFISKRLKPDGYPWTSRWYEDISECINYNYTPTQVAKLVQLNIQIPQTALLSRDSVILNTDIEWGKVLLFKF